MTVAMPKFNAFLDSARQSGTLQATLVPAGGLPHIDIFFRKLANVMSRLASKVHLSVTTTERPGFEKGEYATLVHSLLVSYLGKMPASTTAPVGVFGTSPKASALDAAVASLPAVNLEAFSVLHDAGQHVFDEMLASCPGKGSALAGSAVLMARGIDTELAGSIDSVFSKSFADTYAVLYRASVDGNQAAIEMAEDAYAARASSGDFQNFSTYAGSCDTMDALEIVISDLLEEAPMPVGDDALRMRTLEVAIQGAGEWLYRHGVGLARAQALSEFLETITHAFMHRTPPQNPNPR